MKTLQTIYENRWMIYPIMFFVSVTVAVINLNLAVWRKEQR